jgi:hypothetical protein
MYELIEAANDKEERQLLEVERRAELGDRIDAAFVAACATARVERLAPASQSSI